MKSVLFIANSDLTSCFNMNYLARCMHKNGYSIDLLGTANAAFIVKGNVFIRDWVSRQDIQHIEDFKEKDYAYIFDYKGVDFIADHLKRIKKASPGKITHYISCTGHNLVENHKACFRETGTVDDGWGWNMKLPAEHHISAEDLPTSHLSGFLVIALSAQDSYGNAEYWKNIISKIDYPVILIGRNEVAELAEEIAIHDKVKIYNGCGKFDMYEFSDIINRCRLLVTQQNIWLYIGVALKKHVVAVNCNLKEAEYSLGYGLEFLQTLKRNPYIPLTLKKTWFVSRAKLEAKLVKTIQGSLWND